MSIVPDNLSRSQLEYHYNFSVSHPINNAKKIAYALDYLNGLDSSKLFNDVKAFILLKYLQTLKKDYNFSYRSLIFENLNFGKTQVEILKHLIELIHKHRSFYIKYFIIKLLPSDDTEINEEADRYENNVILVVEKKSETTLYINNVSIDLDNTSKTKFDFFDMLRDFLLNFNHDKKYDKSFAQFANNFLNNNGLDCVVILLKLFINRASSSSSKCDRLIKVLNDLLILDTGDRDKWKNANIKSILDNYKIILDKKLQIKKYALGSDVDSDDDFEDDDDCRSILVLIENIERFIQIKPANILIKELNNNLSLLLDEKFVNSISDINEMVDKMSFAYWSYIIKVSKIDYGQLYSKILDFYSDIFVEKDFKELNENDKLQDLFSSSSAEITKSKENLKYFGLFLFTNIYAHNYKEVTSGVMDSLIKFLNKYTTFSCDLHLHKKSGIIYSLIDIGKRITIINQNEIEKNKWITFFKIILNDKNFFSIEKSDYLNHVNTGFNFIEMICSKKLLYESLDTKNLKAEFVYALEFYCKYYDLIKYLYKSIDYAKELNLFKKEPEIFDQIYELIDYILSEKSKLNNKNFDILSKFNFFQNNLARLVCFMFKKYEAFDGKLIQSLFNLTEVVCVKEIQNKQSQLNNSYNRLIIEFINENYTFLAENIKEVKIKALLNNMFVNIAAILKSFDGKLILNASKVSEFVRVFKLEEELKLENSLKKEIFKRTFLSTSTTNDYMVLDANMDDLCTFEILDTHFAKDSNKLLDNFETDLILGTVVKELNDSILKKFYFSEINHGYISKMLIKLSTRIKAFDLNQLKNINYEFNKTSLFELDYESYQANKESRYTLILYNLSEIISKIIANNNEFSKKDFYIFYSKIKENKGVDAVFNIIQKNYTLYFGQIGLFDNLLSIILMMTRYELLKQDSSGSYDSILDKLYSFVVNKSKRADKTKLQSFERVVNETRFNLKQDTVKEILNGYCLDGGYKNLSFKNLDKNNLIKDRNERKNNQNNVDLIYINNILKNGYVKWDMNLNAIGSLLAKTLNYFYQYNKSVKTLECKEIDVDFVGLDAENKNTTITMNQSNIFTFFIKLIHALISFEDNFEFKDSFFESFGLFISKDFLKNQNFLNANKQNGLLFQMERIAKSNFCRFRELYRPFVYQIVLNEPHQPFDYIKLNFDQKKLFENFIKLDKVPIDELMINSSECKHLFACISKWLKSDYTNLKPDELIKHKKTYFIINFLVKLVKTNMNLCVQIECEYKYFTNILKQLVDQYKSIDFDLFCSNKEKLDTYYSENDIATLYGLKDFIINKLDLPLINSDLNYRLVYLFENTVKLLESLLLNSNSDYSYNCFKIFAENNLMETITKYLINIVELGKFNETTKIFIKLLLKYTRYELINKSDVKNELIKVLNDGKLIKKIRESEIRNAHYEILFNLNQNSTFEIFDGMFEEKIIENLINNKLYFDNLVYVRNLIENGKIDWTKIDHNKLGKLFSDILEYLSIIIDDLNLYESKEIDIQELCSNPRLINLGLRRNMTLSNIINILNWVVFKSKLGFIGKNEFYKCRMFYKNFMNTIVVYCVHFKLKIFIDNQDFVKNNANNGMLKKIPAIIKEVENFMTEESDIKMKLKSKIDKLNDKNELRKIIQVKNFRELFDFTYNVAYLIKRRNMFYFYSYAKIFSNLLLSHYDDDLMNLSIIIEYATRIEKKSFKKEHFLKFNAEFFKNDGLKNILSILDDLSFLNANLSRSWGKLRIRNLLLIMKNLSFNEDNDKSVWKNLNFRERLDKFSLNTKESINFSAIINEILFNFGPSKLNDSPKPVEIKVTNFNISAPTDELIGRFFNNGNYKVVRKIGSGTFGNVYQVEDHKNNKKL